MDTQPLPREANPGPNPRPARQGWCNWDDGGWVAVWVAVFVPLIASSDALPGVLIGTGLIAAIGLGRARRRRQGNDDR